LSELKKVHIYPPIFFSLQIGNNSVYSKFIDCVYKENIRIDELVNNVINYLEKTTAIIGLSLYGDVFQESSIEKLLIFCKSKNIKTSYDISCEKMNVSFFNNYLNYFDLVRVLFFSMDPQKHNKMFFGNEFKEVTDFIKTISLNKIGKVLVMPVLENNLKELESICQFASDNNFKINPLPIPVWCGTNNTVLSKEHYEIFLNKLATLKNIYGDCLYLDVPAGYKHFTKPSICPGLRLSFDVNSLGQVRPCKFSSFILCDLINIQRYWNSCSELWHSADSCKICVDYDKCGGGCMGNKKNICDADYYCSRGDKTHV